MFFITILNLSNQEYWILNNFILLYLFFNFIVTIKRNNEKNKKYYFNYKHFYSLSSNSIIEVEHIEIKYNSQNCLIASLISLNEQSKKYVVSFDPILSSV